MLTVRARCTRGALVLLLLVGAAVTASRHSWAQGPGEAALDTGPAVELSDEQARRADGLVNNMMSPFCPGRTLAGCPSPNAGIWRQDIRHWVKDGLSNVEIEQRMAERAPGFNLVGSPSSPLGRWLAVLLAITAVSFLVFILRRMTKNQAVTRAESEEDVRAEETATPDEQKLETRLDRELEAFDARR